MKQMYINKKNMRAFTISALLIVLISLFAFSVQVDSIHVNIYKHRYPFYGHHGYYPYWGGYGGGYGGISIGGYGGYGRR